MSGRPRSIGILFDRDSLRIPELVDAVAAGMRKAAGVRAAAISPDFWIASAQRVVALVDKLSDVQLDDVLVGAWKVNRQFAKYTDSVKYPPDKVSTVELLTHHLESTYKPYLQLTLDGQDAGRVEFSLKVDVAFKAGVLVIQAGKFRELRPGTCQVTATLSCEGVEVTQRKSGEFGWDKGIPLDIPIEAVV
jgi:hypothetical protein